MTIRVLASVVEFLPVTIQGDPQGLEHEALTWEEEAALPSYALPPQRPPVRGGAARKAAKSGA